MTVSPQWPPDGSRQPSVGGNGVRSDNNLDPPALPPTLFELPNLRKEARGQVHPNQPPANPVPVNQPTIDPASAAPRNSDDEPRSPTPPAVSTVVSTSASSARPVPATPCTGTTPENPRSPERNPTPREQPAGRSWMDRIGSHSVVVVLLLVVIAAGLVIGRDSREQGIDSSLADHSDLLDFDEGTELELPLPKHGYNQPTEIVAEAESSVQSQPPTTSGVEPNAIAVSEDARSPGQNGLGGESSAAGVDSDSPATWLNDPRTDLAATGQLDASRVEVNRVNDGITDFDFVAASSRIPPEPVSNTLPTLDDLDDQLAGPGALTMPDLKTPAPRLSKTPSPIIDWRLYLPREEPATADVNVPFTSN